MLVLKKKILTLNLLIAVFLLCSEKVGLLLTWAAVFVSLTCSLLPKDSSFCNCFCSPNFLG